MHADITRIVNEFERGRLTRRQLVSRLMALGAAAAVGRSALAQEDQQTTFEATALNHIALNVTDVQRSSEFYQKHMGLGVMREGEQSTFLRCGDNFVALFRGDDPGLNHYAYTIRDYDPDRAAEKLEAAGLETRREGNRVYFDDPDGIEVQVSAP